jgi:hypothetical protein
MRFDVKLMLLLSILLSPDRSHAQDSSPSEYQVKAAFLFNFAKFIQWPEQAFSDSKSPFSFGVLGDDPFDGDLVRATREKILNGRPLVVKACRTLEEARNCHVLFISNSEKSRLKSIFQGLDGTHVLTVGDSANFVESGGMINFFRDGNKIRFEIKDETAKKAGLKIDSKLLGLAKNRPVNR